jgi:hypothetical protein
MEKLPRRIAIAVFEIARAAALNRLINTGGTPNGF